MLSSFYKRYSKHLLWVVVLSFPIVWMTAESMPSNNDIETWLPAESDVRSTYDAFKVTFGAEEIVVIGVDARDHDAALIEGLCRRVESLPSIRRCWSPDRFRQAMRELEVPEDEIDARLEGMSVSADGSLIGIVALLSHEGLEDRSACVAQIRDQLEYCQFEDDEIHLAGSPVVVAELNELGSQENNKKFFTISLLVCLALFYYSLRNWKLTFSLLGLTVWAIQLTLSVMVALGYEMNFILGALSVMVMVFTLAVIIHFLHYFTASSDDIDPLGRAIAKAWKPCCLASLTTTIGLLSLTVSDIGPVAQFGVAGSVGCAAALFTGLLLTPAVLTVLPAETLQLAYAGGVFARLGHWILDRSRVVALVTLAVVLGTCIGLGRLQSRIEPLDFLPKDSKVLNDVETIRKDLTNTDSIEAIVDFGREDIPFATKLDRVREWEERLRRHPGVTHTMSLATFFPKQLPDDAWSMSALLQRAKEREGQSEFVTSQQRFWRISARIRTDGGFTKQKTYDDLVAATAGGPIQLTGITPLLDQAQKKIFWGFWESFGTAFLIITAVMVVSLWSAKAGLVAMIPNLTPICIVFGTLGWLGIPVDIGMMMTGSIALGIAVDGTFHFLVRYQEQYAKTADSPRSSRAALMVTGPPILQAAVIASLGMLALMLSSFNPTARFGLLMSTMLMAALIGDLVLLPCLLSLRPKSRPKSQLQPHFDKPYRRSRRSRRRRLSMAAEGGG